MAFVRALERAIVSRIEKRIEVHDVSIFSNNIIIITLLFSRLLASCGTQEGRWTLPAYKPGSVEYYLVTVIPLGAWSPTPSSSLPAAS